MRFPVIQCRNGAALVPAYNRFTPSPRTECASTDRGAISDYHLSAIHKNGADRLIMMDTLDRFGQQRSYSQLLKHGKSTFLG